jgi:fatty acid desaturase
VVVDITEAMEDSMDDQEQRDAAIKRIKDKRDFKTHAVSYVVVNLFLIGVWAVSGGGYFWPGWVLAGWGVGLVLHGWQTYRGERPISEEDIQREMRRSD